MAQLDSGSVGANTMLGLLYDAQQNVEEAERWYQRAVQSSPGGAAAASNNLAWMYAERGGNLDQATRLAQAAKGQDPARPQYNDTLGWIYYRRNMTTQAVNTLQLAIDAAPDNPTYQFHMGMALAQAGDDSRARKALERALALEPNLQGAADAPKTLRHSFTNAEPDLVLMTNRSRELTVLAIAATSLLVLYFDVLVKLVDAWTLGRQLLAWLPHRAARRYFAWERRAQLAAAAVRPEHASASSSSPEAWPCWSSGFSAPSCS